MLYKLIFFFVLAKSYSISPARLQRILEKALFLHFFRSLIDHLFDNLESGKRKYCFGKSLEKVLNFGSKNLYELCISLASVVFLHDDTPAQSRDSNQIHHDFPCHLPCTPVQSMCV